MKKSLVLGALATLGSVATLSVDIASTLYTTLQGRYEEARLGEVSSIPDVRILDRAVPADQPLKNRSIMLLLGGIFGGLGLGEQVQLSRVGADHQEFRTHGQDRGDARFRRWPCCRFWCSGSESADSRKSSLSPMQRFVRSSRLAHRACGSCGSPRPKNMPM